MPEQSSRVDRPSSVEQPYGWVVVAASFLMISTAMGANYLAIVGLTPVAAEFGWPRWIPSLAYSAIVLGAGLGGVAIGWWGDRRGLAIPLFLSPFMVGGGALIVSQSQSALPMLLACGLMIGFFGNGVAFAPIISHITKWFDRRRGIAVAAVTAGQSMAGAAWSPAFNWMIESWGWRETWFWYGVIAFLVILPLGFLIRRRPPHLPRRGRIFQPGDAAGDGGVTFPVRLPPNVAQIVLCLAIVGCCVAMAMPMVHIVAYCTDLGYGSARGAEMLSLLLACSVVSRLAFGWLSDRIGGLMTILIGSSLQAVMLFFFMIVDSLAGLYIVSALFGLVFGGIVPAYALATRQLFPVRDAGWRIGVVFLGGYIGMASGGFLGGWIHDLTLTYEMAFLVGILFNIINLLALGVLFLSRDRSQPRAVPVPA